MLLFDTDILTALAGCDLLDDFLDVLGASTSDVRCLSALQHQLRKSRSIRNNFSNAALSAASSKVQAIASAGSPSRFDVLDRLLEVMDPGEALLIALAVENEGSLFLTGDKRALRAFSSEAFEDIRCKLASRVYCLEAAVYLLVDRLGAETVKEKLKFPSGHATLRIILSDTVVKDDQDCLDAIGHYLDDLIDDCGEIIFDPRS